MVNRPLNTRKMINGQRAKKYYQTGWIYGLSDRFRDLELSEVPVNERRALQAICEEADQLTSSICKDCKPLIDFAALQSTKLRELIL